VFLRIVKAAGGKGIQHEYVRLVENYRDGGKVKQRLVASLGRKELLVAHLEALNRLLRGQAPASGAGQAAEAIQAWDWGVVLVAGVLWRELGLEQILDRQAKDRRRHAVALADRVLALVANRLQAPGSEHGLAGWLETSFVCDRRGRQWLPQWRDEVERRASNTPRVRVGFRQLQRWYRTLDQLLALKPTIEKQLFLRLRDLFSLKVDLVLYDLTSTYFEGHGPAKLAAHGYSRDGKPRQRQVLVGLVMVDGWPIAHHVFAGNDRDAATVPAVLSDLERRFGLARVIFVGDRGMISSDNLALLRAHDQGYILGRNRRRSPEVAEYIAGATGPWRECPAGITGREKRAPPKTLVQEIEPDKAGPRIMVVHSDERHAFEKAQRQKAMARVRQQLEALAQRVAKGRLRAAHKIGAAAGRILARNHGQRYYDWAYEDGVFRFFEHPLNFAREIAGEGKYVIQSQGVSLSPVDIVRLYKELSEVERGFRNLKDVIDMRPIYHQTDERVQAHIFVAALAFLLHRALEKKLKAAGLDLSATEALSALKSIRVVDIDQGNGKTKRCVTRGSERAGRILAALDISDRNPPTPPTPFETLM
jgi:transposase